MRKLLGRGRYPATLAAATALVLGTVLSEAATTLVFTASVTRTLDARALATAGSAPAVLRAHDELDQARIDRAELDKTLAHTQSAYDNALVVARCEINPAPDCPAHKITGVPGHGREAEHDTVDLAIARAGLLTTHARITALDHAVTQAHDRLRAADDTAFAAADRGPGARWSAMHEYTTDHPVALVVRVVLWLAACLLGLSLVAHWRRPRLMERSRAEQPTSEQPTSEEPLQTTPQLPSDPAPESTTAPEPSHPTESSEPPSAPSLFDKAIDTTFRTAAGRVRSIRQALEPH